MPSGRTHDRITLWTLPLVMLVAFRLTLSGWLTSLVGLGFLMGGLMLGPDLDIHSVQYKRWGWLRWIWLPYREALRHRSKWSHGPIAGTLVRVVYLGLWLAAGSFLVIELLNTSGQAAITWGDLGSHMTEGIRRYGWEGLAVLIGLELGALSHSTSDWLVSSYKRATKGSRRPKRPHK